MKNRDLVNLWIGLGCALLSGLAEYLRRWLGDHPHLSNALLGTEVTSASDRFTTPMAILTSAVDFHAAVVDNLLVEQRLRIASMWLADIALSALILLAAIALRRLSIGLGAGATSHRLLAEERGTHRLRGAARSSTWRP
jgi:hypothetical protein